MSLSKDLTQDGENLLISRMRFVLAISAFVITRIDPTEPRHFAAAIYSVLVLYILYSLALHLVYLHGVQFPQRLQYSLHWIDVAFYATLIGLSSGTNSIFFVLFFFCILVAAFRWGFASGIQVTAVSVLLYVVVGYAARPPDPEFDLDRFILRTSALPILGYMISYWGEHELRLKRRLSLLREISFLSNPRFGMDRTMGANMEKLRTFFGGDLCVAVLYDSESATFTLRRSAANDPESATRAESIPEELAKQLMSFGEEERVFFRSGRRQRRNRSEDQQGKEKSSRTAELLGASSFLSVPMRSANRSIGRLFVTARSRSLDSEDVDFLSQAIDSFMPVLDNIILVDKMATRAAEEERQRIARDIHDRIVQPYIGLQLGIGSIRDLLDLDTGENLLARLRDRASRLQALAAAGIADLRLYIRRLKDGEANEGGLVEGLRRFAAKFCEATGIEVEVKAAEGFHLNDRLAAAVFPMLTEALSNVRRHTRALGCTIELKKAEERLIAVVENETGGDAPAPAFVPRSIAEGAASLEGSVSVKTLNTGHTAVIIEIPL